MVQSHWQKWFISVSALGLLASCEWFRTPLEDPTKDFFHSEGLPYHVTFTPDLPGALEEAFRSDSKLLHLGINHASTQGALLKRAHKDQEIFEYILESEGYFEGSVNVSMDTEGSESHILFTVHTGTRYTIGGLTIETDVMTNFTHKQSIKLNEDIIEIEIGKPVDIEKIHDAKRKIEKYFLENGYPFVEAQSPRGVLDKDKHVVYLTFPVIVKAEATIVDTSITGLSALNPDFIKNRITWKNGDTYNDKVIRKIRKKVLQTNLISNFNVTALPQEQTMRNVDENKKNVVMQVKVAEAPPRVFGAGIRYNTSERLGGKVFWHHNNVLGNGEHAGVSYQSSTREQRAKASFDIPDVGGAEHMLSFQNVWLRENTRAYSGRTITVGSSYEVPFHEYIKGSIGLLHESSRIYAQSIVFNNHFIGIPLIMKADNTDDFLDPSEGLRLSGEMTPYWRKNSASKRNLTRTQGNLQTYLPFKQNTLGEGKVVLATYVKAATLFVNNFADVPPTKRFYGGGSGSIRGYGYQKVGPYDADGIPLGGRSMMEWGGELRLRATETIGFAGFFEAASVTVKRSPEFATENTLYGAGAGIRYFSGFGPIRLDVAIPFKRRKNANGKRIDADYQFYIAIGQAF